MRAPFILLLFLLPYLMAKQPQLVGPGLSRVFRFFDLAERDCVVQSFSPHPDPSLLKGFYGSGERSGNHQLIRHPRLVGSLLTKAKCYVALLNDRKTLDEHHKGEHFTYDMESHLQNV